VIWVAAAVGLVALVTWVGPAGAGSPDKGRTGLDSLIIFHTNDTHAHLVPFKNERGQVVGGAAVRSALLERERFLAPRSLTLDGGDVFQGTPYFTFFHGTPDYRAMTMMRYDAGALGNHDLDIGPVAWRNAQDREGMPVLSANVFGNAESLWVLGTWKLADECRRGARWIGGGKVPDSTKLNFLTKPFHGFSNIVVFGLTTPDVVSIVSPRPNGGVAVSDPVSAAQYLVPYLRKRFPIVICVSHLGLDADKKLAERVSGIDVIVGGHSHTALQKPILIPNGTPNGYHGTVIVQAGAYGEYLGRLALYLQGTKPVGYAGMLIPVRPSEGEDPDVAAMLRPYADSIGGSMSEVVFHAPFRVPSSGVREGEKPIGNFVTDAMREAADADIAFINSGGIRAAIPQGEVTAGDIYSVVPFDNRIVVVNMPGYLVRELCDITGRRIGKGGFLQVSGLSYVIKGQRAANVQVHGDIINSDATYRVAIVDYLYDGGDGYTIFKKAGPAQDTGIFLRDAAIHFLIAHPDYEFRKEGRIVWEGSMRGF